MKINPYKIRLAIAGTVGILTILAICGLFYPIKFMHFQFAPVIHRLFHDYAVHDVVILGIIVVLTFVFGRFYCSTICPFGILQEFFAFVRGKKKNTPQGNYGVKYLIAGLTFGALIGGSALLIRHIDPYTIFGSAVSLSIFGIIFAVAVLILVFFKNRFFCTNICPVGAVLGLISKFSLNKIYMNENCVKCGMCANSCPSGCINYKEKFVDNETCIKCLKCLSVCPKKAIKFGIQPVKFNPKRRDFIWGMGSLAILGAGYAAGLNFVKNIAKKVKDIILPAGAVNANRMLHKCLNCNLCINHCPNDILVKSDDKFGAVHIDYTKGKGYCEYNCHKCSEVCPTGAIKKISSEEKQKTRIGMAYVSPECFGCEICSHLCPTEAISIIEGKAVIDGSKCIGCGKCASECKAKAIHIYGVKEQNRV